METMDPHPNPQKKRLDSFFYVLPVLGWMYVWMFLSLADPEKGFSRMEKRPLAAFPDFNAHAVFSGHFFPALSFWFADHFPMREIFMGCVAALEPLMGVSWDSIRFSGRTSVPRKVEAGFFSETEIQFMAGRWQESYRQHRETAVSPGVQSRLAQVDPRRSSPQDSGPVQPKPDVSAARLERVENVFIYGSNGFYIFGGSNRYADRYARIVTKAASLLAGTARVYCLPVPTAIEILLPAKYQKLTEPQRPFLLRISGSLQNVVFVDIYADLMNCRHQYLYYRTDHHWTPLGAYVAYEKFAAAAGYTPNPLSAYQELPIGKYWGSLYAATHNKTLAANPDEVTAYCPAGKYRVQLYARDGRSAGDGRIIYEGARKMPDKYVAFLGGDQPYMAIVNQGNARRNKKILVIKESFGNVFVPFLAPDYREVHVADIRTFPFGLVSFVRDHGIDEVLFINNLFAVCDPYRVREIERLVERP